MIDDLAFIGPLLKMAVIPLISTPKADGFQLDFSATPLPSLPTANMSTVVNGSSPCFISIYPATWKTMRTAGAGHGSLAYFAFAHEVVHCYQDVIWGARTPPSFIDEGSAEFLGVEAAGYDPDPEPWYGWFNPSGPQPSLLATSRSYTAIGWYAVLAQVEGSLWPKMAGAWRAYLSGGAAAFIHALGGDTEPVESTWGPSLVNHRAWGAPWFTEGIGIPAGAYADGVVGLTSGALPAWSGELDRVGSLSSKFVLVRVVGGYGAVHDNAGHHVIGFTEEVFCTDPQGCSVPSQTCANKNLIPVPSLSPPFVLAVSADAGGARFTVGAYKSVGSIPAAISPCDATNATGLISPASLAHFAVEPCALLTFGDWEDVTGQEPSYSAALIASSRYGDCQWEMKNAGPDGSGTNTNFNLGEALIHEGSWALFEAEARALPGAMPVHGLGQQAWCSHNGGPPTVAEAIIVELSPSWALAINAASCAAATYLARQAYDRLKAY